MFSSQGLLCLDLCATILSTAAIAMQRPDVNEVFEQGTAFVQHAGSPYQLDISVDGSPCFHNYTPQYLDP